MYPLIRPFGSVGLLQVSKTLGWSLELSLDASNIWGASPGAGNEKKVEGNQHQFTFYRSRISETFNSGSKFQIFKIGNHSWNHVNHAS